MRSVLGMFCTVSLTTPIYLIYRPLLRSQNLNTQCVAVRGSEVAYIHFRRWSGFTAYFSNCTQCNSVFCATVLCVKRVAS